MDNEHLYDKRLKKFNVVNDCKSYKAKKRRSFKACIQLHEKPAKQQIYLSTSNAMLTFHVSRGIQIADAR